MKTLEDLSDRDRRIIDLLSEGHSFNEIALTVCVTKGVVAGLSFRNKHLINKDNTVPRPKRVLKPNLEKKIFIKTSTLDDSRNAIVSMIDDGLTCSQIPSALGRSSSSHVGAWLRKNGLTPKIYAKNTPKPDAYISSYNGVARTHPYARSFLEITDNICGFPLWKGMHKIGNICGTPIDIGQRYCADCQKVVYSRSVPNKPKIPVIQPKWKL